MPARDEWADAACRQPGAASPFPDDWPIGRVGQTRKARALYQCRACPLRIKCGERALAEYEAHHEVYGVRCGVAFTDVDRARQYRKIEQLQAILERDKAAA